MISYEYGLSKPLTSRYEEELVRAEKLPKYNASAKNFVGIEIEIERMNNVENVSNLLDTFKNSSDYFSFLWQVHEDGSLRNNGVEFVSLPIHQSSLEGVVGWLYGFIETHYPRAEFTERCGIHIHYDICDISGPQLISWIQLYLIYELLIFKWIGEARKNSNFCVPLQNFSPWLWFPQGPIHSGNVLNNCPSADTAKYAALNITCATRDGSIEFRHLPGTFDTHKIIKFSEIIQKQKKFVLGRGKIEELDKFIETANTISNYQEFTEGVYGPELASLLFSFGKPDIKLIETGITQTKKFIIGQQSNTFRPRPMSISNLLREKENIARINKFIDSRKSPNRNIDANHDTAGADFLNNYIDDWTPLFPQPEVRMTISSIQPRLDPTTTVSNSLRDRNPVTFASDQTQPNQEYEDPQYNLDPREEQ